MNIKAYFLKRVRKNILKYRLLNSAITIMCYYQRGAFFLSFFLSFLPSFPLSFFLSFFISTLIELIVRIDQNEDEFIKMVMS